MGRMKMASHDIAHCQGDNCKKKESCHRYTQHLKVLEREDLFRVSYLYPKECTEREYESYWEKKDANKSS